jgi:hypothetical protein
MYAKIHFGLMNAGENFQRDMDTTFAEEKDMFIFNYLYDITVYSNYDSECLHHLKQVFEK